jgi:hypothetical protein
MSFARPGDPEYLRAKQIKQGRALAEPLYDGFVERFRLKYGIRPLAVFADTINRPRGEGRTPRLTVAKQEIHDMVTGGADLDRFTASLGIGDQFWCTQRLDGPPIVFVRTGEQATAIRASDLPLAWADTYFEIARRNDEFGYLTRAELTIAVDSKENFDASYASNWYYFK